MICRGIDTDRLMASAKEPSDTDLPPQALVKRGIHRLPLSSCSLFWWKRARATGLWLSSWHLHHQVISGFHVRILSRPTVNTDKRKIAAHLQASGSVVWSAVTTVWLFQQNKHVEESIKDIASDLW